MHGGMPAGEAGQESEAPVSEVSPSGRHLGCSGKLIPIFHKVQPFLWLEASAKNIFDTQGTLQRERAWGAASSGVGEKQRVALCLKKTSHRLWPRLCGSLSCGPPAWRQTEPRSVLINMHTGGDRDLTSLDSN